MRARLVFEQPSTAERVKAVASSLGLDVDSCVDVKAHGALAIPSDCPMLILEQRGQVEVTVPRVYSLAGANPDTLIVAIVPAPRTGSDGPLLRAGAFDVLDDGPDLEADLTHTLAAARRVATLQAEKQRLDNDLSHQDKLSALGVLAAGVSHEINNPCAAILSNMNVLRDQLEGLMLRPRFQRADSLDHFASDWIEAIGDCISAANRIHSIVKTLNVFSRKSEAAAPVAVDINEEIRTVMRLIGKEVRFQARFEMDLVPDLPRVMAPPNCITQILTNLVVNALQAFEGYEGLEPRVWITTMYDEQQVMLEVGDNGPGIEPDVLQRIFDPFFTTKPVGKGTGLGLSITRQLVQKLGGEIFVDSDRGSGARFSVVLERAPTEALLANMQPRMPPANDRLRVLLLDDDELILRSMQRSLSQHFECQAVAHARMALSVLNGDAEFDVVVSDVVMPEMNGLEFYSTLEHTHPDLAARTVFISGGITSEVLHSRVSDTGRPCLAKPVDEQELIRTIRRLGRPFEGLHR